MSLKDGAEFALGSGGAEAVVWVFAGLVFLTMKVSIYLFAAVLVCCGLLSVLLLRRVLKLDIQAVDDPNDNARSNRLIAGRDD